MYNRYVHVHQVDNECFMLKYLIHQYVSPSLTAVKAGQERPEINTIKSIKAPGDL